MHQEDQAEDKSNISNDEEVCEELVGVKIPENNYEGEQSNKNPPPSGLIPQCLLAAVVTIAAVGGGMPIGYSAVLLPQLKSINGSLQIDDEMGSWIASIHSTATPIGSFFSGTLMDSLGRKVAIQAASIPFILGWICIALAQTHAVILIGRVLTGVAVALALAPCGVYIAEIAHPSVRGVLCSVPHASFIFGIFLIYILGSVANWRLVAGLCTIFPTVATIIFYFLPESPVWLVRRGKVEQANDACLWFRGGNAVEAEKEIQQLIKRTQDEKLQQTDHTQSIWREFCTPQFLKPFVIINIFHFLQILTGPYVIVFYAVDIISSMGIENINKFFAAVLTAGIRFIFTVLASVLLAFVGRRALGIGSALGTTISALCLAIILHPDYGSNNYFAAICLLCYVAAITIGISTLPGVMIGELFPTRMRGTAVSIAFTILNLILFGSIKLFPLLKTLLGVRGFFLLFSISSLVTTGFIYCVLPETKNKTLNEIEDYFLQDNYLWITRNKRNSNKNLEKN